MERRDGSRRSRISSFTAQLLGLKIEELVPALLCAAYFFSLLLCYYLLRPTREAFGISRGYDKLSWLMTGTLIVTALASPLFAIFASRQPRRVFVPWASRFFASNILLFAAMLLWLPDTMRTGIGYAFYIWLSVFNLFVVSVFWAVVADVFGLDRGKRVFAIVAVGGTLGAIAGAAAADLLSRGVRLGSEGSVVKLDAPWLLLISIIPLECASLFVRLLRPWFDANRNETRLIASQEPSRDPIAGLKLFVNSPFLMVIGLFMLLFAMVSTLLYIEQGRIVEATFPDEASRRSAFASIDMWANVVTLVTQLLIAGRIMRWVGPRLTLLILPMIYLGGFLAMILAPSFLTMAIFQVLRRGLHYAIDRPVRELLFAGLTADARYKAKTMIDTFVYRAGDMVGSWSPKLLTWINLAASILPAAVAISALWLGLAGLLGWLWDREKKEPPEAIDKLSRGSMKALI